MYIIRVQVGPTDISGLLLSSPQRQKDLSCARIREQDSAMYLHQSLQGSQVSASSGSTLPLPKDVLCYWTGTNTGRHSKGRSAPRWIVLLRSWCGRRHCRWLGKACCSLASGSRALASRTWWTPWYWYFPQASSSVRCSFQSLRIRWYLKKQFDHCQVLTFVSLVVERDIARWVHLLP